MIWLSGSSATRYFMSESDSEWSVSTARGLDSQDEERELFEASVGDVQL